MNDPGVWHRLNGCRYVLTAAFALDYEVMKSGNGTVEGRHGAIIIANKRRKYKGLDADENGIREAFTKCRFRGQNARGESGQRWLTIYYSMM
jgi:hypothetical protein